jgi:filamentous hemagglutinin
LGFAIQHNSATDITTVQAGRDFIDSTNVTISSPVKHVVTGPGLMALQAGRDIDLGNSFGVVTRGNLDNAYLSAGGASVVAVAGAQQTAAHNALSPAAQLQANQQLFTDLVAAGKKADLTDFDKLIADAFPVINGGDINVFGSQVKTEQGGSIDLLAPGGSVVAGLVSVPVYLQSKPASENGIFTVRGGAIRSLVKQDFLVNQGRVFSLGGGDISLISQYGNIDAGRGTKTASSAPPPLLTTDASGNTKIDISASISGSGIATLSTSDKQAPSNVYAVAPRGIFDAGDAGVRSTGTVEIQASVVLNAGNIAASSGVSGAVAVDAGAAAASAAPSNTNSTQDATKQLAAAPQDLLGLTVELLGFGDAQDPKSDADESEEERKKRANAKSR